VSPLAWFMRANRFSQSVRGTCLPQLNCDTSWLEASSSTADRGGLVCSSFNYRFLREESLQCGYDFRWTIERFNKSNELRGSKLEVFLVSQKHFSRATGTLHDETRYLLAALLRTQTDQALLGSRCPEVDPPRPCRRLLIARGCHPCPHHVYTTYVHEILALCHGVVKRRLKADTPKAHNRISTLVALATRSPGNVIH